ncbi:hypothetical protein TUN199_02556 [Pyrenophora tritici-repentis]|nr:hypothetical protein TUN199_02556 [Pyrenophora tritici-repentis]
MAWRRTPIAKKPFDNIVIQVLHLGQLPGSTFREQTKLASEGLPKTVSFGAIRKGQDDCVASAEGFQCLFMDSLGNEGQVHNVINLSSVPPEIETPAKMSSIVYTVRAVQDKTIYFVSIDWWKWDLVFVPFGDEERAQGSLELGDCRVSIRSVDMLIDYVSSRDVNKQVKLA